MQRLMRGSVSMLGVWMLALAMVAVNAAGVVAAPNLPAPSPYPSSGPSCTNGGSVDGQGVYSCQVWTADPVYKPPFSTQSQPAATVAAGSNDARFLNQCKVAVALPFPDFSQYNQYHANQWIAQTLVDPTKQTTKDNLGWTSEFAFIGMDDYLHGQPGLPIYPGSGSDGSCPAQVVGSGMGGAGTATPKATAPPSQSFCPSALAHSVTVDSQGAPDARVAVSLKIDCQANATLTGNVYFLHNPNSIAADYALAEIKFDNITLGKPQSVNNNQSGQPVTSPTGFVNPNVGKPAPINYSMSYAFPDFGMAGQLSVCIRVRYDDGTNGGGRCQVFSYPSAKLISSSLD